MADSIHELVRATIALFVIVDPVGTVPLVTGITAGMIFLLFNANARTTDARDINPAVRNIKLYASAEGKCPAIVVP